MNKPERTDIKQRIQDHFGPLPEDISDLLDQLIRERYLAVSFAKDAMRLVDKAVALGSQMAGVK